MLDKLIEIIPQDIKEAVNNKDWNLLEELTTRLLNEADYAANNRWIERSDRSQYVCMKIAALEREICQMGELTRESISPLWSKVALETLPVQPDNTPVDIFLEKVNLLNHYKAKLKSDRFSVTNY